MVSTTTTHTGLRVRHRYSERGDVDYYYDQTAVLEEHNASDGTLLAHYTYADRMLSLNSGEGLQYYHHDALGSTVNLTDSDGNTIVSYTLGPWGDIRSQTGASINRQIFTGQEHDENTDLIYFGARYYDPDICRFITQDPYLGDNSIPPSLHRYLYAYSNPTVYIDLLGYDSVKNVDGKVSWIFDRVRFGIKYIDIGEYRYEDGKTNVYLTEELGGGVVDYHALQKVADQFLDRKLKESDEHPRNIGELDPDTKKTILRDYIDAKLNPHREPRIQAENNTKGFVSEWIVDYEQMIEDITLVQRGAMTPGEFVMKFGYETVQSFLLSKIGGQVAKKLKGPLLEAIERLSKKSKKRRGRDC